ncbi:hypothetical protein SADUNF_Sadunf05G0054400 [Salix dunnii]|uniref:Uncharacterized protein n=1 Tax=Salix dunnii TaxID=1413687 RepID=A0A835K2L8_9ROSI|nr:hypothetical protein SADUNF_Sadunf05G0054400 [Salix dunnii]
MYSTDDNIFVLFSIPSLSHSSLHVRNQNLLPRSSSLSQVKMYSIGVTCAEVYVKQKLLMEKMKRIEEERVRRGENVIDDRNGKGKNKVYPGYFPGSECGGKQGDSKDNVA